MTRPRAECRSAPPLGHAFFWSLASTVVYSACQLGFVVVFARWGDAATVGRFALAMAIAAPIVLLANCALRTVQASQTSDTIPFGSFLAFRLLGIGAAGLTIGGVALVCESATRGAQLAVGAAKLAEALGDLMQGAMQREERMDLVGKSQILKGVVGLLVMAVAFDLTQDLASAAWAWAASMAAIVALYDLPVGARLAADDSLSALEAIRGWFQPCWRPSPLGELLSLTWPLGLTVMSGALNANICRYFLELFRGPGELGVFAALSWVTLAGAVGAGALAHAALPRLARYYATGRSADFSRLFWRMMWSGGAAGSGAIAASALIGPPALELLYGAEYGSHRQEFVLLVAAAAFAAQICFLDHALYAARRFRDQAPLNLAAGATMAAACIVFLPTGGGLAAAWITCLGAAGQMAARLWIVRRLLREHAAADALPVEESEAICESTFA